MLFGALQFLIGHRCRHGKKLLANQKLFWTSSNWTVNGNNPNHDTFCPFWVYELTCWNVVWVGYYLINCKIDLPHLLIFFWITNWIWAKIGFKIHFILEHVSNYHFWFYKLDYTNGTTAVPLLLSKNDRLNIPLQTLPTKSTNVRDFFYISRMQTKVTDILSHRYLKKWKFHSDAAGQRQKVQTARSCPCPAGQTDNGQIFFENPDKIRTAERIETGKIRTDRHRTAFFTKFRT